MINTSEPVSRLLYLKTPTEDVWGVEIQNCYLFLNNYKQNFRVTKLFRLPRISNYQEYNRNLNTSYLKDAEQDNPY